MGHLNLSNYGSLHYQLIEGADELPYLVFLHEGLGCVEMWKSFPQRLCDQTGCPGLIYDRLGYGKSDGLKKERGIDYVHEYALKELPAVVNMLIPGKDHILIGHSDGGSIALLYGTQNPAALKGIISEAAHVFVEPLTVTGIEQADAVYEKGGFSGLKKYHGEKTELIFKAWTKTWLSDAFLS